MKRPLHMVKLAARSELEELHCFCLSELEELKAQRTLEVAGMRIAFARVMVQIRKMQAMGGR